MCVDDDECVDLERSDLGRVQLLHGVVHGGHVVAHVRLACRGVEDEQSRNVRAQRRTDESGHIQIQESYTIYEVGARTTCTTAERPPLSITATACAPILIRGRSVCRMEPPGCDRISAAGSVSKRNCS